MKQRFSSIDVKVIAHELSAALVSLRVSNIYDLSSKIFLVKFSKPSSKEQIIIDSGFRCHLTSFSRATAATPSMFVTRLRKYLKTRRVTKVAPVGTDRVLEFQFSEGQYRLYLEFYAGGNVILTDKELNILALLRVVAAGEGQEELRIGMKYSLENRQNFGGIPLLTKARLQEALQKSVDRGDEDLVAVKKKKKASDALRRALAVSITEFPPMLVDHAMRVTDFDSSHKPADVLQSQDLLDHLMRSLEEAQRLVQEITSSEVTKGYIFAKKKDGYEGGFEPDVARKFLVYEDFHPFRPLQFENNPETVSLEFHGFNKTVDEFFSSIEGQMLESRLQEREQNAKRKIEAARQDQAKRLGGLQEVQELNIRKAGALQANPERVQEAMDAVNGLIAQGMDWVEIGKLVEIEQKRHNPVATIIKLPLKLQENTITLLLDEEEVFEDDESADETGSDVSDSEDDAPKKESKQKVTEKRLIIDINLALSPWANAREYYDQKRTAAEKEQKTLQSSSKALKSQEAKINRDLKTGLKKETAVLRPVRRQMWFEKFHWFISSDGYLVLAGKDALQNEHLYRKHLKKGDIYVHAEVQGAASVVIRNNPKTPDAPIPPSTLSQAGTLSISCSSAWDAKAGMSAWWVTADQVAKSAPNGEFLPVGNFMIKGKKNFLPPAALLLGFGVLLQISEESTARHTKHRLQDDTPAASDHAESTVTAEVPELDDDQNSIPDDYQESETDEEDRDRDTSNPLQTQPRAGSVISDGGEEELIAEISHLEVRDTKSDAQGSPSEAEDSDHSDSDDGEPLPVTGKQTSGPNKATPKGPAPPKRGKRGKAKKIATKYKDQDEEDRIFAQKLIGASAGLDKAAAEAEAKQKGEEELAFQKERRKAQHERTQKDMAEYEAIRKAKLEAGSTADDDAEEEKTTNLDTLIGKPLRGDEILEAIPFCAPWAAMGNYKYKVKLQPGTQKKGKAIKDIMARWVGDMTIKGKVDDTSQDAERMWPREVELLRAWKVEEVTNTVFVSKVRVMMTGGTGGVKGPKAKGKSRGQKK
ncbi:related to DUF814 domain protein [Rhynchosporium secalis]|uniref:Ribosome quality control complex subunit 2 n=1 Tax=Rhynchosporium secalis TaxID=38038 RepID=A0A1E1MNQ7_RHYSE|nr:related to DUF814 domain protein [Rhynchosporium secalis]